MSLCVVLKMSEINEVTMVAFHLTAEPRVECSSLIDFKWAVCLQFV